MNAQLFRATVKKYMELKNITSWEQLRGLTTVGSINTIYKYKKYPPAMPIEVFEQIMTALEVPYEERHEILN